MGSHHVGWRLALYVSVDARQLHELDMMGTVLTFKLVLLYIYILATNLHHGHQSCDPCQGWNF